MKNHSVIGIVGHVDHGKTTLIKHLTGKDTDHLKEEKERNISINIAFSYLEHKDSIIGFIDMPGHAKYIKNMLAGAFNVDSSILCVACDDGIMPQTIEHLNILKLLGINKIIVVLTKTDKVAGKKISDVKDSVREHIKKSGQLVVDVIETSHNDPASFSKVKDAIIKLSLQSTPKKSDKYFLNIDRSFVKKGRGTVVTGTSIGQGVKIQDTLYLYPNKVEVQVKSIHSYDKEIDTAINGARTAMNISGVSKTDITRGAVLSTSKMTPSDVIDVKFKTLDLGKSYKSNMMIDVYLGTNKFPAKLKFLGEKTIKGGQETFAQLLIKDKIYTFDKAKAIIREPGQNITIGSVEVINVLGTATKASNKEYVNNLVNHMKGINTKKFKPQSPIFVDVNDQSIRKLIDDKTMIAFKKFAIHGDSAYDIEQEMISILTKFHESNPKLQGIRQSELFKLITIENKNPSNFNQLLKYFVDNKSIKITNNCIFIRTFDIRLTDQEKSFKNMIIKKVKTFKLIPESLESLINKVEDKDNFREVINYLTSIGSIKSVADGFVTMHNYLEAAKVIMGLINKNSNIKLREICDEINLSRVKTISILDSLEDDGYINNLNGKRIVLKRVI